MFKRYSILFLWITACIWAGIAQTPTPTPTPDRSTPVMTDAGFIADAAKAFADVKAQKDVIEKFLVERATTDVERASAKTLIKSMEDFLGLKDRFISQLTLMVTTLQGIIEFQFKIIDQLKKALNRPNGFWHKFFNGLKEILKTAVFILVGAKLGASLILPDDLPFNGPLLNPSRRRGHRNLLVNQTV